MEKSKINILVTGGSGFLGKAIVRELIATDALLKAEKIVIFDIKESSEKIDDDRIEYFTGDIRDPEALKTAFTGIDIVIHSAAMIDWGIYTEDDVLSINFTGTENVINACLHCKVRYLVFTSSLDAIYDGNPLINVDESHPYPNKHRTSYCRSKYLAELAVVKANSERLKTVVLRPSDIFGEADPYHIDSLVNMAKSGFYVRIGNGKAQTQHVYVGNIAHAHLLAGSALLKGSGHVEGQIYFITDSASSNFFKFFDRVVEGIGYKIKPKNFWIPRPLAYVIASLSEFSAWIIRPVKFYHPKFSRFAVTYTCTEYTFTSDKAKRDFGFVPKYSPEEAMKRTIAFYRRMKSE